MKNPLLFFSSKKEFYLFSRYNIGRDFKMYLKSHRNKSGATHTDSGLVSTKSENQENETN